MSDTPPPAPVQLGLRASALRGGRAGATNAAVTQLVSLATTAVLARLLTPADYGRVAAATLAYALLEVLTGDAIGQSLVRRREVNDDVASTVFWASLGLGVTLAILLAALSPSVAGLTGQPDVAPLIAVMGFMLVINQAANVPRLLLSQRLAFTAVYRAEMANIVVYSITAITLAVTVDIGAWTIVAGRIAAAAARAVNLFMLSGWRPRRRFVWRRLTEELRWSRQILPTTMLGYYGKNVDYWLISRVGGPAALGPYYVAYGLPTMLRQRLTSIGNAVLLPLYSKVHDDRPRLVRAYWETTWLMAMLGLPALVVALVAADELTAVFFGPQWRAAATPMRIISGAGMGLLVASPCPNVFYACDRLGYVTWAAVLQALIVTVLLAPMLGRAPSAVYVASAMAVSQWVVTLAMLGLTWGVLGLGSQRDAWRSLGPPVAGAVVGAIAAMVARAIVPSVPAVFSLMAQSGAGLAGFLVGATLVDRSVLGRLFDTLTPGISGMVNGTSE